MGTHQRFGITREKIALQGSEIDPPPSQALISSVHSRCCKLQLKVTEAGEEIKEVTVSLAAAREISMDAVVVAVLIGI